jgi:hypothetical protein
MEEVAAYQKCIDRIRMALTLADGKRQDRKWRNLKNKANGGFPCLRREYSLEKQQ